MVRTVSMASPEPEEPPRVPPGVPPRVPREGSPGVPAAENGMVTPDSGPSPGLLVSRVDGCVLPYLGGFGRYQKQLVLLTWIPALFIGFSQMSDQFLLARPTISACLHSPRDMNGTGNGTDLENRHSTTVLPPTIITTALALLTGNHSSAHPSTARWIINDTDRRETPQYCDCNSNTWRHELQSGLAHNVVTQWNLVCGSAWKVHIAKFSLLVGSIFGFLMLGVLADWFGRHPVLIVSVFFTLVFGLAVAFSVDVTMFSTLRFFEGFWLAGITLSLYVLRIELCLPGWRFSMTMVANFVVLAGQLLMPGLATICSNWQILQAVIICPLLLMLTYIWLFPESLRWLLATQQYSRSKWLIERIAKKNANPESHELITELNRVLEKKPKKTCIVKMVGTRNLWKNIVVLCVNSLAGYGIHHCFARSMMDQNEERVTMFHNFYADYYTMAGIALATCLALCPAVGTMGRRGGLLLFMIITALASLLQLGLLNLLGKYSVHLNIVESDTLNSNFSKAFSIIGMFSSQAVSNLSIFFCAEITPTVIRGGGLGLVLASAGFGMLTAPIMELHNQKGYFLHHVIFACCTLICIICILLLPESRHQPLPESLSEGEGYTRHPLLPPHKKPAEQRHLLPDAHARSYAHDHANNRADDNSSVKGTPLHTVAVSTVESTASSTIALDEPGDLDNDLNAVRLSVLKCNDSTPTPESPAATDSLPDLIINAPPPETSETPPPLDTNNHPEFPSVQDNDTNSSTGASEGPTEPVTPPTSHIAPPQTTSSPIDSDPLPDLTVTVPAPPVTMDSTVSSPIDSDPLPFPPPSPVSAPLKPTLDLTVTDPAPPVTMDSTVSSPIDSAVDCTISPANGGASS
ncbi:solute carrier family 22 member 23 [Trichomycterus rosablanca]|uniref:solute carrier family 22 member 23 n=1 Tax=Trichomycterus rosablanca TaxID=2290929 RepID=UPI002F352F40